MVCWDEAIGCIIEQCRYNSQQTFLSLKYLDWFWDASSGIFNWCWGSSPVLKMPGHKACHPTASSSEVLKEWSYTSNTPYSLMTHQETHLPVDWAACCTETSVTFSIQLTVIYQKTWIFINTAVRTTDYAKRNHNAYRWLYLHGSVEWCSSTVSGHYETSVFTPTTYIHGRH